MTSAAHGTSPCAGRPYTLVLGGGGARGFSHAGVLRALDRMGHPPSAIIGVSMGAIVGAAYALRPDWYEAILSLETSAFPQPVSPARPASFGDRLRRPLKLAVAIKEMFFGWGPGTSFLAPARAALDRLTLRKNLDEGHLPLAVCATDLVSGRRVILRSGPATEALHASAALAGVAPPLRRDDTLLADGVYADIAPIDVARDFGYPVVIAVDPGQAIVAGKVHNGLGALLKAIEICQLHHADLRFGRADFVLRPHFRRTIDTLEFGARRECIAAGLRAVRQQRRSLAELLGDPASSTPSTYA
ncbi:MAG: patatin-like phospholipase family protein [Gemmatimonadota bacterium]|nr:patatin-like phospholipase family protein [Gemmatimonadota bacterium]